MLVVSLADFDQPRLPDVKWDDVLSLCETIAGALGGLATVNSDALNVATDLKIPNPEAAAYAAFWGTDRSGRNPRYRELMNRGLDAPYIGIVCQSWNEVSSPNLEKLQDLAKLLA
jgi:hypothetical protein